VVQTRPDYDDVRRQFSNTHGALVWEVVTKDRPYLEEFFPHHSSRKT
jgi:hypothetical protein